MNVQDTLWPEPYFLRVEITPQQGSSRFMVHVEALGIFSGECVGYLMYQPESVDELCGSLAAEVLECRERAESHEERSKPAG